jgi:cell division protein FtsA
MNRKPIVALDMGTTKVCVIVAEIRGEDINVKGIGVHPSHGLRKGIVVDVDETVSSISQAVKKAENNTGMKISSVYVGIAGSHIESFNYRGSIPIENKEHVVTDKDIDKVVDASCPTDISADRDIIHIIPRTFFIDGQNGVSDPEGMAALKLEVESHIVTASITSLQNMIKCVRMAGLGVDDIVLQQLASSEAVLTGEERRMGTLLVDIGGGTTDVAVFQDGSICYSWVLPIGGTQVTRDLAVGLNIDPNEAERVKIEDGSAISKAIDELDIVEINPIGKRDRRPILRKYIAEIIESRMTEIFVLVRKELIESDMLEFLPGGIVITGGASQLEGLAKLVTGIFRLPVRIGSPERLEGSDSLSNPVFSTGVGLLVYGKKSRLGEVRNLAESESFLGRIFQRFTQWFRDFF